MSTERQKVDEKGIVLRTRDDVWRYAADITATALCPKAYVGKPREAMIAILAGMPLGLSPIQCLMGIAVIGGRPSLWGDIRAGVVLDSGKVEWVKEWFELEGKRVNPEGKYPTLNKFPDLLTACWQAKRKGMTEPTRIVRFSVGDAKLGKLWEKKGKQGGESTWCTYPLRMLQMRVRAFGERDFFADALAGLGQIEEQMDIPQHEPDPLEDIVDSELVPPAEEAEAQPDAKDAAGKAMVDALQSLSDQYCNGWKITVEDARKVFPQASELSGESDPLRVASWLEEHAKLSLDQDEEGKVTGIALAKLPDPKGDEHG